MHAIVNIFAIMLAILAALALVIVCAFAVVGVIYLFGDQDDWTEVKEHIKDKVK